MSAPSDPELEAMARTLEATGDYRVLRRFCPPDPSDLPPDPQSVSGLILDFETTGLDPSRDRIIQLALVPFVYARESGAILGRGMPIVCFEDPGRPIPAEITSLTGITDEDVAGHRIDEAAVLAAVSGAGLIIAHNAGFDRPFAERRMPIFRERAWACSRQEVPWQAMGLPSSALEFLLIKHCGVFHSGHRADHDCLALLHLLETPFASGSTPFQLLLAAARRSSCRIWAVGAPIEHKDTLKRRGYRWNNGSDGRPKAWYRELPVTDHPAELAWLTEAMYGGRPGSCRVDVLDARTRYSDRAS